MKLITFTVPCYNSQEYMRTCIDSLLTGGEDVEIIIVNDGSKDDTLKIAKAYADRYPQIIKVIDKENGGHGSGVNAGLKAASGLYFKVVDSDDRLDADALKILINAIKSHISAGQSPDMYVTNFVYDRQYDNQTYVSEYSKKMPPDKIIGWEKIKKFRFSHMLLMHSLIFKRENLLQSGVCLPEHTFYVDNLFSYQPLPYMKTLYYLPVNLYWYFIGRGDQSVTRENFTQRYKQQARVMRCIVDAYKWDEIKKYPKGLKRYMFHAIEVIMMLSIFFTNAADSPERRADYKDLWRYIKERDKKLYKKLRHFGYPAFVVWMTWKFRGKIMLKGYNFLCRKIKLGKNEV